MENHKYISLEIDGYNPNLYRMTYKVPGDYHIREIYIDMSGNIQDEIPYDMPWDVQEELNEFADSLRNTDDVYVDVFEKEFEEFKKQKKTASKNLITIFLIYIINFLWYIVTFFFEAMPFFVVTGHFTQSNLLLIIYLIYFFLGKFVPVCALPVVAIQVILTIVGLYFAFTEFPIWFAIFYTLYAIYYVLTVISKFKKGIQGEL